MSVASVGKSGLEQMSREGRERGGGERASFKLTIIDNMCACSSKHVD